MHVLVAAHDLYPDPGSGGTGRYVYETGRRLVERGHQVSVITRRRGDGSRRGTVAGIDVYRYDFAVAGETAPRVLNQLPVAHRTVQNYVEALSRMPDVVSFQGLVTPLFVDRAVPDSVSRVTTFHSPWPTEYAIKTREEGRGAFRRWLNIYLRWLVERHVLAHSDGVITLSGYMQGQLRRVYESAPEGAVVPGGVDSVRFSPDAGEYAPMKWDGPVFLTVRRLSERMGHDRLLEAFATLREAHPDARLYIAGDGPIRDQLEQSAADLDVADRTTFLGYIPDEQLSAVYATADIFVLPTQQLEGFGLATLEALAAGTPVVATPVGGTVEVLSGLRDRLPANPLVPSVRAEALADGMRAWADLAPATRERAGETCRRYARDHYTWEQTVDALLDAYERHYR